MENNACKHNRATDLYCRDLGPHDCEERLKKKLDRSFGASSLQPNENVIGCLLLFVWTVYFSL
jgi:hypothetical protein